jgi:SNF2 family DNA or RNA helicase
MHSRAAESEDDYYACPSCDRFFTDYTAYAGPRLDIEDDDMDSPSDSFSQSSRGRKSKKGKGKDKDMDGGSRPGMDQLGFEPKTEGSSWVTMSDNGAFPLAPSAKTATLKAILLQGFEEAPFDKVVIYVQFRLLARIVGRLCSSEGWGFLYLTGDSSLEHRTKAISQFRTDPDVKILIAGLKCGGLGLNFPWANRCISLDLWWNHAVEQQAFGRIFRIGQMKETFMTRIVVRNSVDMRLLTMQMYKVFLFFPFLSFLSHFSFHGQD